MGKTTVAAFPDSASTTHLRIKEMKTFKQFLEDYDVYIDKPMGFKKVEPEVDELEVNDTEDEKQEESEGG